jgi:Phospholipase_D-nuclease N-terminal
MRRKRWRELNHRQQAIIVAAVVVQELLSAATLLDLRRRPGTQVRGSKKLWVAAAFVNLVGPIAYFTFGRRGEQR